MNVVKNSTVVGVNTIVVAAPTTVGWARRVVVSRTVVGVSAGGISGVKGVWTSFVRGSCVVAAVAGTTVVAALRWATRVSFMTGSPLSDGRLSWLCCKLIFGRSGLFILLIRIRGVLRSFALGLLRLKGIRRLSVLLILGLFLLWRLLKFVGRLGLWVLRYGGVGWRML